MVVNRIGTGSTMKTSLLAAATTLAVLCALMLSACATPQPIPDPPGPAPAPTDMFDHAVANCDQAAADAPVDDVRTCLDVANTAPCLEAMYPARTPDTILCTLRALNMSLHVNIERTGGNDQMKAEAAAADRFIREHQIGYR
jgi:hypothetical protein